jgi:hypothetical protein
MLNPSPIEFASSTKDVISSLASFSFHCAVAIERSKSE